MDSSGKTALHIAAEKGSVICVNALIKAGADINARDNHDNTPLHLSATSKAMRGLPAYYDECGAVLANAGADLGASNNFHKRPMQYRRVRQLAN